MARIKKYKKKNTTVEEENLNKRKSIKKTEKKEQFDNLNKNKKEDDIYNKKNVNTVSYEDTACNILNLWGEKAINNVKNNKYIKIPFTYDELTDKEWLVKALKTIFDEENLALISRNLNNKYYSLVNELKKHESEIEKLKKDVKKKETEISIAEEESDKFFEENKVLKIEVESSVKLDKVFENVFNEKESRGFLNLVKEANEDNPGDDTNDFFLAFLKSWTNISIVERTIKTSDDEEKKVEIYDKLLSEFLLYVKDINIPQRRAVLDALARYINKKFKEFEFISPEETTRIDIDIHNAKGIGGNKIKQGISFAVLRKNNRQTFKYADIETF